MLPKTEVHTLVERRFGSFPSSKRLEVASGICIQLGELVMGFLGTGRLLCSSFLVMACFLIRKELHRSLQVLRFKQPRRAKVSA